MANYNRGRLIIDLAGDWTLYTRKEYLPPDCEAVGTVALANGVIGALVYICNLNIYARMNDRGIYPLNERKVAAALKSIEARKIAPPKEKVRIAVFLDVDVVNLAHELGRGDLAIGLSSAVKKAAGIVDTIKE